MTVLMTGVTHGWAEYACLLTQKRKISDILARGVESRAPRLGYYYMYYLLESRFVDERM